MNYSLPDKIEQAFAVLVRAAMIDPAVSVLTGKAADDKILPCVICSADGEGEEDPKGTGNFWVKAEVAIKVAAADDWGVQLAKAYMQSLTGLVTDTLHVEDLAGQLTAAVSDLTVFPAGVIFGAPESGRDDQGAWIDLLPFRLYCCGSSLE